MLPVNLEPYLRPQKIRGFGLRQTRKESADSVADSESVTTLVSADGRVSHTVW